MSRAITKDPFWFIIPGRLSETEGAKRDFLLAMDEQIELATDPEAIKMFKAARDREALVVTMREVTSIFNHTLKESL